MGDVRVHVHVGQPGEAVEGVAARDADSGGSYRLHRSGALRCRAMRGRSPRPAPPLNLQR